MDGVDPAAIVIEPARAADAPGVIALIGRVFAEYGFSWDPSFEVPDLLDLERHYGGAAGAFWVARLDGQVVGVRRRRAAARRPRGASSPVPRRHPPRSRCGPRPGRGRSRVVPLRGDFPSHSLVGHPLRPCTPPLRGNGLQADRRARAPRRPEPDTRVRVRAAGVGAPTLTRRDVTPEAAPAGPGLRPWPAAGAWTGESACRPSHDGPAADASPSRSRASSSGARRPARRALPPMAS